MLETAARTCRNLPSANKASFRCEMFAVVTEHPDRVLSRIWRIWELT